VSVKININVTYCKTYVVEVLTSFVDDTMFLEVVEDGFCK